jgi:DNA-binding transcriptional regulator of glucitol operon
MDSQAVTLVIILLVGAWILQFWFSHRQLSRFYRRLKMLRKDGLTAIGMTGNRLSGRVYGVLTVDRTSGIIVHAESFQGATIFASLKPVPQLEGQSLDAFISGASSFGVSQKLADAFLNAARDIQTELAKPQLVSNDSATGAPAAADARVNDGTSA